MQQSRVYICLPTSMPPSEAVRQPSDGSPPVYCTHRSMTQESAVGSLTDDGQLAMLSAKGGCALGDQATVLGQARVGAESNHHVYR